ncbi:unnamed protein product [Phaedon cochleariae]|uniref:Peptidase M13 N-terminal domain-containing protein n=1 Tax=Phaedon cochleariae TaxID=80249 RepID=A0A9P0GSG9_PHACE|nr:unnamed protein product [Phaedon cochleariae]
MARTGTYSLNRTKDTSFRNFILVLLVVLALLVLIYLVMAYGLSSSKKPGTDSSASTGQYAKLSDGNARMQTTTDIIEMSEQSEASTDSTLGSTEMFDTEQPSTVSFDNQPQNPINIKSKITSNSPKSRESTTTPSAATTIATMSGSTNGIDNSQPTIPPNIEKKLTSSNAPEITDTSDYDQPTTSELNFTLPTTPAGTYTSDTDQRSTTSPTIQQNNLTSSSTTTNTNTTTTDITYTRTTVSTTYSTDANNNAQSIAPPNINTTISTTTTPGATQQYELISSSTITPAASITDTSDTTTIPGATETSGMKESTTSPTIQQNNLTSSSTTTNTNTTTTDITYTRTTVQSVRSPTTQQNNPIRSSTTTTYSTDANNNAQSIAPPNINTTISTTTTPGATQQYELISSSTITPAASITDTSDTTTIPGATETSGMKESTTSPTIQQNNLTSSSTTTNTNTTTTDITYTRTTVQSIRSPTTQQNNPIRSSTTTTYSTDANNKAQSIAPPNINTTISTTTTPGATQQYKLISSSTITPAASITDTSDTTTIPGATETSGMEESTTSPTIQQNNLTSSSTTTNTNTTTTDNTSYTSTTVQSIRSSSSSTTPTMSPNKAVKSNSSTSIKVKTCEDPVCKKISAQWLAMMNYDEGSDPCDDFYNFACGGTNIAEDLKEAYFDSTSKALINRAKEKSEDFEYPTIFVDFYRDCMQHKDDFMMEDILNSLNSIEQKSLTDIFIDLLLSQSMPFFDVGLRVDESESLGYEINLPENSPLKTGLTEWSLIDQMQQQCIEEISDKIKGYKINLSNDTAEDIRSCVKTNTKNYITRFVKEMDSMFSDKSLVYSFKNHSVDLQDLMDDLLDHLLINYNSFIHTLDDVETNYQEIKTLKELNEQYKCRDLNWVEVFKGITRNVNITEDIPVKVFFSNYTSKVLDVLDKKQNIHGILNLWFNVQRFRNTRPVSINYGRKATHCMRLASQLMPDISVSLVNNISAEQISPKLYERVENLFQQLKSTFNASFEEANMTQDSVTIFQDRLNQIQLRSNANNTLDRQILFASGYGNDLDVANKSYHEKLMILLSNYRTNVYSLVGKGYSGDKLAEILLLYFVDPFETEPKTFPPSRHIVFPPGFVYGMSPKLPAYVELATKGFRLGEQIAKHFEKDDFSKELQDREERIYTRLESDADELDLIGDIKYKFDNVHYEISNIRCVGKCANEIFEDNTAFRLVTDIFKDLRDSTILPFMDETVSTEKSYVSFIAHEFCKRQTIVEMIADLYGGRKLPAPMKTRNMIRNSNFFNQLYQCGFENQNMNQFPYIVPYFDSSKLTN